MSNELKKKYQIKLKELNKHNKLYYEDSNPTLSDASYDILKKETLDLENKYNFLKKKDSPSITVGHKPSKNFVKSKHRVRMLSLSNAFDEKDLIKSSGFTSITLSHGRLIK